jgi:hypothetical protein
MEVSKVVNLLSGFSLWGNYPFSGDSNKILLKNCFDGYDRSSRTYERKQSLKNFSSSCCMFLNCVLSDDCLPWHSLSCTGES